MNFRNPIKLTEEQRVELHERITSVISFPKLAVLLTIKYIDLKQRMYGKVMFSTKEYTKLINILEQLESEKNKNG